MTDGVEILCRVEGSFFQMIEETLDMVRSKRDSLRMWRNILWLSKSSSSCARWEVLSVDCVVLWNPKCLHCRGLIVAPDSQKKKRNELKTVLQDTVNCGSEGLELWIDWKCKGSIWTTTQDHQPLFCSRGLLCSFRITLRRCTCSIICSYKARTSWDLMYVDLSRFNNESLLRILKIWSRIGCSFGSRGICTAGESVIFSVLVNCNLKPSSVVN